MTDDVKKGAEDALDWGDALEDWELALDAAEAESSPFPSAAAHGASKRAPNRGSLPTPLVPAPSALADAPQPDGPRGDEDQRAPRPTMPAPERQAETLRAPPDLGGARRSSATQLAALTTVAAPAAEDPLRALLPPDELLQDDALDDALLELEQDAPELGQALSQARALEAALPPPPPGAEPPELELVSEPPEGLEETPERARKQRRIERLECLAHQQREDTAAALWISAAELAEELGDAARAERLYGLALSASPKCAQALDALARLAFRAGEHERYMELLAQWSELPVASGERARVLAQLALARWAIARDAAGALGAATEAQRLAPELTAPSWLLARIELSTDPSRVDATLVPLAQRTQDRALAAALQVSAGRAVEARGDRVAARALYAKAASDDPFAFDAQLSLARVDHALGANTESAHALLRTLESFDIGPVAEAVRRRAAHMLSREGAHREALELLEHASDDVSLRTAMQIAIASGERELQLEAACSWAGGSDRSERALALLTHAELLAEGGDPELADRQLELAALADPGLALVSITREALARKAGNAARLAEIAAGEEAGRGALAAAAKLALAESTSAEELTWLSEAADEESGASAHLLAIDASAELGRGEELRRLLRAESERGASEARVLSLLSLAEQERQRAHEHPDAAHDLARHDALQQASELSPREPLLLRALARATPAGDEAAYAYRLEAESSGELSAAFAYLREGYALAAGSPERLDAFVCAANAAPSYAPASWALHREARRQGDLPRLSDLHGSEAAVARTPEERAAHLVRAALIRASEDTETAAQQLTRALELTPEDPVLGELVVRLGDAADGQTRVTALRRSAQRVREPWRRMFVLAAASTLEDEGRGEEAAQHYREVLENYPDDPIAEAGLERVQVEHAQGTLEEKRRAVNEASTERARARALEELLLLEPDPTRALELANELAALSPSHPLALRALERDAMARDDRAALLALQQRFVASTRGPHDKAARTRFVHVLRALEPEDEAAQDELDRMILDATPVAQHSTWLLRQLVGSAIARHQREPLLRALDLQAELSADPVERCALIVARGWLAENKADRDLSARLQEALAGYPDHPTAQELLAELKRESGDLEGAAQLYARAGERAQGAERAASLWARAAELWDRHLHDAARARDAYQRAAEHDVESPGVRERLAALLDQQGDLPGLIALTTARVQRGGPPEQQVELLRKLASLEEQRESGHAAREALRAALTHAPDSLPVWRDLARLAERQARPEERVEALQAIVRLSRDPLELRDVLLELGDVYDQQLADPTRAEAAYQRVLKLGPRNIAALERLASLYRRGGADDLATEALAQLARATSDPRQKREVTLLLASWTEDKGDARAAEELLETLRRAQPTDPELLRALAGLLQRQNAHVALAMHLNRAVNDLRMALSARFDDPEPWRTIVSMLVERGRVDVAHQCARTAQALGLEIEPPTPQDEPSGIGAAAVSELLDDLVFPDRAPASLRIVFRHAAEALNKVAPLDLRMLGAEKLDRRHPLRSIVAEQARWVAHRDIEVWVSAELPFAFVPIQESPVQLLVGRALIDALSPDEQRFLVARALKIARAQMSICCRLAPPQMELLLHALVRSQVATHAPAFVDLALLDETARQVGKQLSRRAQSELVPHLLELTFGGAPRFDAANVYGVASVAGSRAGLLATGQVDAALSALVKLSGTSSEGMSKAAAVAQVEEARELVSFAISEGYFEARVRAGQEGS